MNPYQPPNPYAQSSYAPRVQPREVTRTPFILAAIGAWLACAYWAALTLLFGISAALGSGSFFSVIFPCVLIFLYAARGLQLIKGDAAAAQRIIWLHLLGMVGAVMQMGSAKGAGIVIALQAVKILIHIFGGITAFLAHRAAMRATQMY